MSEKRIRILFNSYLAGLTTDAEEAELMALCRKVEYDEELAGLLDSTIKNTATEHKMPVDRAEIVLQSIFNDQTVTAKKVTVPVVHRIHFLRRGFLKYAAAIIIIAGIGAYLWNNNSEKQRISVVKTNPIQDVLPGSEKAILTLADGSTIILDSALNGQLTQQGSSKIIKLSNGELTYQPIPFSPAKAERRRASYAKASEAKTGVGPGATIFNTMSTPRGGQYQLTLPDGSKAWLNAASSITFPTTFTSSTRTVSITGEVYFEISPNKSNPFIVKTSKEEIKVLGTSFNVNTYPDEPSIKTSLISGSVKINENILQPGQAYTNKKVIKTNISKDIAWKNGVFQFDHASIPTVMRQLSRWYNIDIIYKSKIPDVQFSGKMLRKLNLSQVLLILNKMEVRSKLENGKTLIIE